VALDVQCEGDLGIYAEASGLQQTQTKETGEIRVGLERGSKNIAGSDGSEVSVEKLAGILCALAPTLRHSQCRIF
jgi:hypothetical protein